MKAAHARPIDSRILVLRGQRVMLDVDLAALYGVQAKALNQAVKRNLERFPGDFLFRLTPEEAQRSRSQIVTLNDAAAAVSRGSNIKYLPYAFTEQGVAMLSSVLKSKYDKQFKVVFDAIRELMTPSLPAPRRRIGF
jgi:hypothetical protein